MPDRVHPDALKELVTVLSEPLAAAWERIQGGPEG